jgi:hypothetical protein
MVFTKVTKAFLVAGLMLLPACGPDGGFSRLPSSGVEDPTNGQVPVPPEEVPDLKGFISGGIADRVQVLSLDAVKGELLISLPLGKSISVNLPEMPIEKLPGARVYSSTSSDGTKYIVMAIPLKYVLRNVTTIPAGRLPNGDALPNMPAGELPTIAFSVANSSKVKIHLFVGMDAVAIFVDISLNTLICLE